MHKGLFLVLALFFFVATAEGASASFVQGAGASSAATDTAADDYSGMYNFLRDGEFVQITLEAKGKVTGFISRYGDLESDRGAFLDQFIKQGSIEGHNLAFSTETVHGVWYEFKGSASRGDGKTVDDEGYYVLKGTLTQHSSDGNHHDVAKSREVTLKSFPQDVSAPTARPKD